MFRRLAHVVVVGLCLLGAAIADGATITEIIPAAAPRGARVLMTGSGLADPSIGIAFRDVAGSIVPAAIVARADSFIEAVVPPDAAGGPVTVTAGTTFVGSLPFSVAADPSFAKVATLAASQGASDLFKDDSGVAVLPDGSVWVADTAHHQLRKILPNGSVALVAGDGSGGLVDGPASTARFRLPAAVAWDAPRGLLYVADSGNNTIRRVAADGSVSTLAGSGRGGDADGAGAAASFRSPSGVAVDAAGNVYVADTSNSKIRFITPAGVVSTIAGTGRDGATDGAALQAQFRNPNGIAFDAWRGAVWIADTGNDTIRLLRNGIVSTIAGSARGFANGDGAAAAFNKPTSIAVDDSGDLFVADSLNDAIRRVTFTGGLAHVSTISGGTAGFLDGPVSSAQFHQPVGIAAGGALYVADSRNQALRAVDPVVALSAVYPRKGSPGGGETIRLLGSGFVPGATSVTIGGVAATGMTFVSWSELLVVVPATNQSGLLDVVVMAPGGSSTLSGAYSTLLRPAITSLQPVKGSVAAGQIVTVTGANFVPGGTTVRLGNFTLSPTVNNATTLTFTTPALAAGVYDLTVTTSAGSDTRTAAFTAMAAPVVTAFAPPFGAAGAAVTISGLNFDSDPAGNAVRFGNLAATVTAATPSQLQVTIPAGATTGTVSVTTAGGTTTSSASFYVAAFTSLSVQPASASVVAGNTQQLTATAATADGTSTDVTSPTSWSSNNTSVAFVDVRGIVHGNAAGSATVTATFGSLSATSSIIVTNPQLPPDPSTVATTVDPTRNPTFSERISFLYSGANPIQTGVAPGTIAMQRAVVLRGSVVGRDGSPRPGVRVSIVGHPELGSTLTRTDGAYDLAVNGGGTVTLSFDRSGIVPSSRSVDAPWQDFVVIDPVVVIDYDPHVTAVSLGSPALQVATGSVVTDDSGSRLGTLMLPPSVQATITMPDGSSVAATSLHIRATEYTVGSNGPSAMPAVLPPTSAYTYCVELSADEASAAGAASVDFDKPVAYYVNNFLHFPVGTPVPVGYYDRQKAVWMPSDNGIIIGIVSITNGMADIDLTGDGVAEAASTLANYGITDAQRAALATTYVAGDSLWRFQVTHFTPWDANFPYAPPPDATAPNVPGATNSDDVDDSGCAGGSIIDCENQTLRQRIPIANTPFSLNYGSDRAPQQKTATLKITLTKDSYPASLTGIELEIFIAGRKMTSHFAPSPNLTQTFVWDGTDSYGRIVQGSSPAKVRIGYTYNCVYTAPAQFGRAFGAFSNTPMTGDRFRKAITLWQESTAQLVYWTYDARQRGVGGWTLDVHHAYNLYGQTLYRGDGSRVSAAGLGQVMQTVAGNGCAGYDCPPASGGAGGPATSASLREPAHSAVAPDGTLYFADSYNHRVCKIGANGLLVVIAGTGVPGFSGDGGPATAAQLNYPEAVALDRDGTLYISDSSNYRIRRVTADGIITTYAGGTQQSGVCGGYSVPIDVKSASFCDPRGISFGPDGSLYIADGGMRVIYRVTPDQQMRKVAGVFADGSTPYASPGLATERVIGYPSDVQVDKNGNMYIADLNHSRVHKVTPDGIISVFAGNNSQSGGFGGDGGPSTQSQVDVPESLALDRDGQLYISDYYNYRIRKVDSGGIISTLVGNGVFGFDGESGHPTSRQISTPRGVAVSPGGTLYVSDYFNHRIRAIQPPIPGFATGQFLVPSSDGAEAYLFDESGRHLKTMDPHLNITLYTFGYDAAGHLASITDAASNVTTIERDASGSPTAIVSPYGVRTQITTGADGYISAVTTGGQSYSFTYGATGRMSKLVDPHQNEHSFTFDSKGALTRDDEPGGSYKILLQTGDGKNVRNTTVTTAAGRVTTFARNNAADGSSTTSANDPNGRVLLSAVAVNRTQTLTQPDGSRIVSSFDPDPVLGLTAAYAKSTVFTSPSGKSLTMTLKRDTTLADSANPLSVTTRVDTLTVNGRAYVETLSATARTLSHKTPGGRISTDAFDAAGRLSRLDHPGVISTSFGYDGRGNLQSVTRGSRTSTRQYDSFGRLQSINDALHRGVAFTYDENGRIAQQSFADGRAIGFGYDAAGNVTSVTPPGRPAHLFTFNAADLPETYTPPGAATPLRWAYNLDHQLTTVTRLDGSTIGYGYDGGGRLSSIAIPTGSYSYQWNPSTGTIASASSPDGETVTYQYDGPLQTSETWSGPVSGSIAHSFDANLRLVGENGVALAFDPDELLVQAGAMTLARDAQSGRVTGTTLGGVTDTFGYNGYGETTSYAATFSGSSIFSESSTRDDGGRITQRTESLYGVATTYAYDYDPAGHLQAVHRDGSLVATYGYDANGNRVSKQTPSRTDSGTTDDRDRLLTFGSATMTWYDSGELKTKTDGSGTTTYSFDALGNLRSVALPNGHTVSYVTDGQNRRVGKLIDGTLVRGWLYADQFRIVAELDGSGNVVSRFVYGTRLNVPDYMLRDGNTYRIVSDHLGTPRLVIDVATGALAQSVGYDEFGTMLSDSSPGFQPFGFGGGLYDPDTALVHFASRDYSPQLGRWTSPDPLGFDSGTANFYAYALSDPVNMLDIDGLKVYPDNFVGPLQRGDLHVSDVGNIVYNETSSLRGDAQELQDAREAISHVIINGSNRLGPRRPITSPTTPPSANTLKNPYARKAYGQCQIAAHDAFTDPDDTNGATHYNFRENDSDKPFQGHKFVDQYGPFTQTVNTKGLAKCTSCVYGNIYE